MSRDHQQSNPFAFRPPQVVHRPSFGGGDVKPTYPLSRLSPPPGANIAVPQTTASSTSGREDQADSTPPKPKKDDSGPKRGYRACVHCRMRKARCDLGDVNAPSSPPCSRCRREQRTCVFVPSKRRKKRPDDPEPVAEVYPTQQGGHAGPSGEGVSLASIQREKEPWPTPDIPVNAIPQRPHAAMPTAFSSSGWPNLMFQSGPTPSNQTPNSAPLQSSFLEPTPPHAEPPSFGQSNTTPASVPESTGSSALSPSHPRSKKRRQHSPDATRRIVAANFSNEIDALEILANAAADPDSDDQKHVSPDEEPQKGIRWDIQEDQVQAKGLEDYCLVKENVLTVNDLENLVRIFFENHHPVLPIFQTARIPKTIPQLAELSSSDPFLLSAMILVASRHHPEPSMKQVHEKTWKVVREALADYSFSGLPASVGFVEGVLLLAEFLPRERSGKPLSADLLGSETKSTMEGMENRRSWALTGLAIRAAYGIGLDQISLEITGEKNADIERARSAWTWCYLYDRTIGLRTGLAFWSRGPNLCFTGYSHVSQTGEAAARENFPYMLSPGGPGNSQQSDDSASLMQALMELTQIMTNAHDILYPSKGRTSILVSQGTYFKYCDHFRKALETYALVWTDKQWKNPALRELACCTYQFVRLYVSSFAFQAHVQRAQMRAEASRGADGRPSIAGTQLFPRGSATSPDALYIYESIDAANEILHICLRLGSMGVLQNLPSRYLMNFVYGGVFALKAGYSGATSEKDLNKTKEVVDHMCAVLVLCSPDRDHPASRYGGMLRMLAKKLEQLSDQSAVPSRFPSPEPLEGGTNPPHQQSLGFANAGSQLPDFNLADFNLPPTAASHVQDPNRLFDYDLEGVNFNLDGFWEDFSLLGEGSGFPFK
ncbi:hypothetical protein DB88DRAFT_479042 [Papiliotrema laurentii]|uniref:Zn(2)-C6 fungal-type domain-containing protein n=1 Tax=Papiliotrema laurentii TaxID=5418 RepID=A0AAD9L910_PAPLA|nr:hypothetical protein DB88DRAFT_479042 [Papiliotrema laurentii]